MTERIAKQYVAGSLALSGIMGNQAKSYLP
jgi:hypothetical protein